jgi:hypothetical protein
MKSKGIQKIKEIDGENFHFKTVIKADNQMINFKTFHLKRN